MNVLGFDASLTHTGIASVGGWGHHHTTILTNASEPLPLRLRRIADGAFNAAAHWPGGAPDLVIVEVPGFVSAVGGADAVYGLGEAIGAVIAGLPAGLDVRTVRVQEWRGGLGLKYPKGSGKAPSVAFAESLGVTLPHATARSAKIDADVAEAYCIAEWGLRAIAARV